MQSAADLSRLIDRIYTAAETGDGLLDCLNSIRDVLGGTSAHLMYYAPITAQVALVHSQLDPTAADAYLKYFYRVDPWESRLPVHAMNAGLVLPGSAVLPREELKKTEFYADFGRPFGATRTLFGVARHNADGSHLAIALNRNDRQEEFDEDAVAYLSLLVPHLGRALEPRSLWAAAAARSITQEVLDTLPCGVILVDAHAEVCLANTRASALLFKRDGIAEDGGRLRGATTAATRTLRELCAEIAAQRGIVPRRAGATLQLPRARDTKPLQVLVTPVQAGSRLAVPGRDIVAVLYISDPSNTVVPDATLLREAFGLTAAESKVAALLAAGRGIGEIADELRYTVETTRWYCKQILAKTDSRTRSEFTARAVNSIAMLRAR